MRYNFENFNMVLISIPTILHTSSVVTFVSIQFPDLPNTMKLNQ